MYLSQRPVPDPNLLLPAGVDSPPRVISGTELGHNGTVFNYCYAMMTLSGPKLKVDYYQVNSTDAKPGNPPPLEKPVYSESLERAKRG